MSSVVFIGFRATGKTTLAKRIAARQGLRYISTDEMVVSNVEMSIAQYVAEHGWNAFRKKERDVVNRLHNTTGAVIDCGGGIVEYSDIEPLLRALGPVVWVDASIEDIEQRMQNDTTRPLLSEQELRRDIELHYERRRSLYGNCADIYINTSDYAVEECVSRIEEHIGNGN